MTKVLAYEATTAWNRGIPCNFSKYWSNCICFVYFSVFELLYQTGYQRQYVWTWNLKVLAYEAATAWNRGIPCNFFQNTDPILFVLFIFYFWLAVSNRVSKAIYLNINFKSVGLWGSYGLEQGNPLQNIKIANQIVFVLSPGLLFYLMYQKGYQR